ncbi:BamA/TamA family outer membrane protein [Microcoleus sp. FACHB-831]|uniref:BamA/TamA family outer membrane protein n=1 Tax=Microcoleus sp. FACHB-831 TaxID=2692827 RepID=UPI00168523F1|nr:BamA/TamA family outer membrane protein [Microcoleus sp. FACHB-831]MBD1924379.1 BamA/TamA family outer membrane protein [Microcoleus sp. FACHB-831]
MRAYYVAILTLAALTNADLTHQAIANTNPEPIARPDAPDYVVPVTTATPQPTVVISPPEAQQNPQFAGNTGASKTNTTAARQNVKPTVPSSGANRTDLVVMASDVQVVGANQELEQVVLKTIKTKAGGGTSQSQLQDDVDAILTTGLFADARVSSNSNNTGVKAVFEVKPLVVRSLQLSGAQVLTPAIANNIFKSQLGSNISPAALNQAVQQINKWYADNGYALAQVLVLRPNPDGVVTLDVAEGVVGDVNIRFLDKDGKPTKGRTKEDFLTSQLKVKPGQVFRVETARQDLQQLYQTGLVEKADVALNGDSRKVAVSYDVVERPARSVNAGGGYSEDSGLFATASYKDQNVGGEGKQVAANVQMSGSDLQFDGKFANPYRASEPDRLGYTINAFRRRELSQTFNEDVNLPNGSQAREGRIGGGIAFNRPVGDWQGEVGLNYTRTTIRDRNGKISTTDESGNSLSYSGTGIDDKVAVTAGITRDKRDNPFNPSQGSVASLSTEQTIPVGNGNILMNKVQANYSQYVPVGILNNSNKENKEVLAFNVQGGTTLGNLPPYEAFNLGGQNSVRGYGTGEVASARSYVLASAEYRFPLLNPVGGVLFADFGSDLGSSDTVPGQPGVVRDKPGSGFGYGAGLRVNSPLGILRADLGFSNQGESKLQFGIGQRF